jgi:hypothetical protein
MSLRARIAATAVVLAVLGAAIGDVTWSQFSAQASNPGDAFAAGTVSLGDNDAGAALVKLARARPGESATGCVKYTYTGTLPATVRYYATVTGSLAPFLTVTATRGTQGAAAFPSCTGFTADARDYFGYGAGIVFSGTLSTIGTSYAGGLDDPDATTGGVETWTTAESHVVQWTVTMGSSVAAKGLSAGVTLFAEAHDQ